MEPVTSHDEILHGRGDLILAATQIRSTEEGEDSPESLPTLSVRDMEGVLRRALAGEVSFEGLWDWADAIEGRTDLVRYENRQVADLLFELATPEVDGELSRGRVEELLRGIKSYGVDR
jgi:hypothetical protein